MLFVIRFTDHQDRKAIREENLELHISWLAEHKDKVLVAGSLRSALGENPVGAFWVVEASTKEVAENLYKSDPFWTTGLRKEVEILHWSKAFPDQQTLV